MTEWFYAILITLGVLLIIVFLPWLFPLAGLIVLGIYLYEKYGTQEKREFQKLNKQNQKIQYNKTKEEQNDKKVKKEQEEDSLKALYEEYKEKKKIFSEKNNIKDNKFFFWKRYGNLEKIYVIKKQKEIYLFNSSNNFKNFKEDYNNSLNNENLFEKNGLVKIDENKLVVNDTRHIIRNTYHYNDATKEIFLGSLLFGNAGALAGAVNSKTKQKELVFSAGDVTITIQNEDNNSRWEIPLEPSMLVTIAEIFPNIKVEIDNTEEKHNLYV